MSMKRFIKLKSKSDNEGFLLPIDRVTNAYSHKDGGTVVVLASYCKNREYHVLPTHIHSIFVGGIAYITYL